MPKLALFYLAALLFLGCDDDTPIVDGDDGAGVLNDRGLVTTPSAFSVDSTAARLVNALEAAGPVSIVARVDHAANAEAAGLELPPTRVILFGNPALGTPLMLSARTTGIDLPQKVLVWEGADGQAFVTYNSPAYLDARHGLDGVDGPLEQIGMALANFASEAAGDTVLTEGPTAEAVAAREGLALDTSAADFEMTYAQLKSAIESNGALTLVAELDHAQNAASAGLELPPTRLLVFGNPQLGTQLMQAEQTVGIDLPQKMLVWQEAEGDAVYVAYNDPFYLAERHGIEGEDDVLSTIQGALRSLTDAATTGEED